MDYTPDQSDASHDAKRNFAIGLPEMFGQQPPPRSRPLPLGRAERRAIRDACIFALAGRDTR